MGDNRTISNIRSIRVNHLKKEENAAMNAKRSLSASYSRAR